MSIVEYCSIIFVEINWGCQLKPHHDESIRGKKESQLAIKF